jgi:hypothetical protein
MAGDSDAIGRYARSLEIAYADYLREQAGHYLMEGRWADRVFWERRQRMARPTADQGT